MKIQLTVGEATTILMELEQLLEYRRKEGDPIGICLERNIKEIRALLGWREKT